MHLAHLISTLKSQFPVLLSKPSELLLFSKPKGPQRNQGGWQEISEEGRLACRWQDIFFLRPGQEKSSFLGRYFYRHKKDILKRGERETFPLPFFGSSGLLNNQSHMKQIGKRHSNLILCAWEPPHVYMRESETRREHEVRVTFGAEEVRRPGASEGHSDT